MGMTKGITIAIFEYNTDFSVPDYSLYMHKYRYVYGYAVVSLNSRNGSTPGGINPFIEPIVT